MWHSLIVYDMMLVSTSHSILLHLLDLEDSTQSLGSGMCTIVHPRGR